MVLEFLNTSKTTAKQELKCFHILLSFLFMFGKKMFTYRSYLSNRTSTPRFKKVKSRTSIYAFQSLFHTPIPFFFTNRYNTRISYLFTIF